MKKINLILMLVILLFSNGMYSQSMKAVQLIMENDENDLQVEELGYFLENAINENDKESYISKLDPNAFRVNMHNNDFSKGAPMNDDLFKGLLKGIESLPIKLISEVEMGSDYSFVSYKYDVDEKKYSILFRLYSSETGMNYHNYIVSKSNGEFKFSDIYIYLTGEHLSETLSRIFLLSMSKKKSKKLALKGDFQEFKKIISANNLAKQGKVEKGFELINSVKGKFKKDKFYYIIKSQISNLYNEEEYKKTLKEMIEAFPDDNTLALTFIDYYVMIEDYDTTINLLNSLEESTQDDFLNYMKGNVEFTRGDYTSAGEYFKYTVENYPDFFEGYISYISILNLEKNFSECCAALEQMLEVGYDKTALAEFIEEKEEDGSNELEDLVNSTEYKEWRKE